jgi:hypothetical protein
MLAGRVKEPNLTRSCIQPDMYTAMRTGSVKSAVFVGESNATQLSFAAAALGLDAYKFTKGGWKLTKENVHKHGTTMPSVTTNSIHGCLNHHYSQYGGATAISPPDHRNYQSLNQLRDSRNYDGSKTVLVQASGTTLDLRV